MAESNPTTVLTLLAACAAAAGLAAWPKYKENSAKLEQGGSDAKPLSGLNSGGDLPAKPGSSTAGDGNSLVEQMAPNPNSTESRLNQGLQEEMDKLKKENADLRKKLSDALIAKMPPPTEKDIFAKVELLSSKKFKTTPKVKRLPLEEIGTLMADRVKKETTPEQAMHRIRAYQAMGFVPEADYEFPVVIGDVAAEQWQVWYDAETDTILCQDDADFRRIDGRFRLATGGFAALMGQHFPRYKEMRYIDEQDDAARALRGFIIGEIAAIRYSWETGDDFMNVVEDTSGPASYPPVTGPNYVIEEHKRTQEAGRQFAEYLLTAADPQKAAEQAYQRPPTSTTELLHPDLYFASPPFQPIAVALEDPTVDGKAPYYTNVVGELGIMLMFDRYVTPELAAATANGWHGDRYYVYDGPDPMNATVVWRSVWQSDKEAREFMEGLCRTLPRRFSIPLQKEYFQPNFFAIRDPNRVILVRMHPDGKTVTMLTSAQPEVAKAMEAKFFPQP